MAIIDPQGLFRGERLAECSDKARLYWPYFFVGSNGYGRIELSYVSIISKIFGSFRKPPKEDEVWSLFEEYAENFLVTLYQVDGSWWAQFETSEKFLPRFKTATDRKSPSPHPDLMEKRRKDHLEWKKSKSLTHQRFQKFSENSGKFPIGIGVGEGIGIGVGDKTSCAEPSPAPALDQDGSPILLPTNTGDPWPVPASDCLEWASAYPGVNVLTEILKARAWLNANSRNRKTASGMKRFLVSWLNRAQNSARSEARASPPRWPQGIRPDLENAAVYRAAKDEVDEQNRKSLHEWWLKQSDEYKAKNPWVGEIPKGV